MLFTDLLLVAAAGLLSGALNVIAGGGSLFVMPLLMELGFAGPVANGTARVGVLGQNAAAILRFRGGVRLGTAPIWLAAAALPGAALGAFFGVRLEGDAFRYVLAGVMIAVWAWMTADGWLARRRKAEGKSEEPVEEAPARTGRPPALGLLAMVGVGFYGGFLQAGVGFLLMAVLHRVLKLDLVRVNATKVWVVGLYTLLALPIFASRGAVDWTAGLALTLGTTAGGWLGARLTIKRGAPLVRVVYSVALLGLVVRLVFF